MFFKQSKFKERKVFCLKPILNESYEDVQINSHIMRFVKKFDLPILLKNAGFFKTKGINLVKLISFVIQLVFIQKNLYEFLRGKSSNIVCQKDTVYRFLNDPCNDWRKLLLSFGAAIIKFYKSLTGEKRVCALVIDDSAFSRNRSKKVELLALVKDHVTGDYFKGFRKLTAGWTDGASFVPLGFSLLSSANAKKRLYEQGPDVPKDSPGKLRREEAICKGTDVTFKLVQETLIYVQEFDYVLFDSWFSWPKLVKGIKNLNRDVICMLKNMPTIFYTYQGRNYKLSDLYAQIGKNKKNTKFIASVVVDYYGIPVRIVFVRNRNEDSKREWLALLSTNITISEEEIIRIYGLRWDIEVYFKVCKSFLRLAKEFQGRSYDLMVSHTSIVCIRYMLLGVAVREESDDRSHGGMFFSFCDEVKDMDFQQAFALIIDLLVTTLRDNLFLSDAMVDKIVTDLLNKIPAFIKHRLKLKVA